MANNLNTLRAPAENQLAPIAPGFGSLQSFELMQRAAKLLSSSTLVPVAYRAVIEKTDRYGNVTDSRENPNALANAVVALNMAQRMGADPLMVMQNLYIVEGRPSWSSQWIIAAINGCGRFSPLRFDIKALGKRKVEYVTFVWENKQRREERKTVEIEDKVCVAWAVENGVTIPQFAPEDLKEYGGVYGCCKEYGVPLVESPEVSIELAVKEGWYTKNGSKWQTMPDVMLRYRTASFFGKLYAPELLMGLQTVEEAQDVIEATTAPDGTIHVDVDGLSSQQESRPARRPVRGSGKASAVQDVEPAVAEQDIDPETGEVLDAGKPAPEAAAAAPADDGAPTFDQVAHQLRNAASFDALDIAADLIRDVSDPDKQAELQAILNQRAEHLQRLQDQYQPQPTGGRQRRGTGGLNLE